MLVLDAQRDPIAGAQMDFEVAPSSARWRGVAAASSETGHVSVDGSFPPGRYRIVVYANGYKPLHREFAVADDPRVRLEVQLDRD